MFTFGFAFLFLTLGSTQVWADANADNSASVQAVQQQSVAKGRVVDANGEPLVGVSVFEEGSTSNGTITDADGNFTLSVPRNASIVVSYVGFETQSLRATGNMNVVLQEESNELNEVIVVGYGTQKKADLSGSVVAVNVEQLAASRPISNIGTAMAGQVAGLTVLQSGNNIPGAENPKMLIRGTGTMNEAGPLVIIDGVEGYLNDVDASDIEQVTVLKDAASAAIYGSRAANGVILVTTKSGKKGQMRIGYNGYVTFQSARMGNMKPVSDFAKHMEYMNEAYTNNGETAPYSQSLIDEWRSHPNDPLGHPNTDWVEEIFGTGVGTKSIILPYEWYDGWGTTNIEDVNASGADPIPGLKPVESIIWAELDADGNPVVDDNGVPNTSHTGNTAYGQLNQEYSQQNMVWRKFVEEGDWGGRIASRSHSPVNWPIIRFADVLLMLAEAYVSSGQAAQAAPLVNRVRGRVGMPAKSNITMADIEYERCMEFAVEGLRYWDLKRWGKYCSTVNGLEEVDVFGINRQSTKNFDEARWEGLGCWPIPQAEINKNPNLEQNPGWVVK